MTATFSASAAASALPSWLALERLSPFDAYAQAMGTAMLVVALLQWLCSFYSDARALRIFALLYLLTGLGWLAAHPRAHGGADDVPLLSALVAVALLGMNVWGLYEFLGLARRRAWVLVGGTAAVGAGLALWLHFKPQSALAVYSVMAGAFAYCSWLALRAARHEDNVGHLYVAVAFATYPLLFMLYLAMPDRLAQFEMGYYAAVPGLIVGMMMLAVSLIRARQRSESELQRRIAAEDSLRQVNNTLEERVAARTSELHDLVAGLESFNRNVSHDLRDPLAGVSGLAQLGALALQRDDKAQASSYLDTIQAQAEQMTDMVQDLLQLSRVADAPLQREQPIAGAQRRSGAGAVAPVGADGRGAAARAAAVAAAARLRGRRRPDAPGLRQPDRQCLEVHCGARRRRPGQRGPASHAAGRGRVRRRRWPGPAAGPRGRTVQALRAAAWRARGGQRRGPDGGAAHRRGPRWARLGRARRQRRRALPVHAAGALIPRQAVQPASASSSTSTQCRTGVAVPLCRCWMQPMLAETMACGLQRLQLRQLAVAQLVGQLGLQHAVGAGRAAAQVAFAGAPG